MNWYPLKKWQIKASQKLSLSTHATMPLIDERLYFAFLI